MAQRSIAYFQLEAMPPLRSEHHMLDSARIAPVGSYFRALDLATGHKMKCRKTAILVVGKVFLTPKIAITCAIVGQI